jgi:predicted DNA-binding transcriptional regulator AlpA
MKATEPAPTETAAESPQGVKPRLLKIAATAVLLGVSEATVERLHASASMPAPIKLCRDLLWDSEELNAWIDYARKNGGKPLASKEWSAIRDTVLKPSRN